MLKQITKGDLIREVSIYKARNKTTTKSQQFQITDGTGSCKLVSARAERCKPKESTDSRYKDNIDIDRDDMSESMNSIESTGMAWTRESINY